MSTTANDPINPCVIIGKNGCGNQGTIPDRNVYGLTKREYFAAMAMQGLCSLSSFLDDEDVASYAVKQADLLIKELNK
jgi:hypothetical protein